MIQTFITRYKDSILILGIVVVYRLGIFCVELLATKIPLRTGYLGPIPWANLDGQHYLSIAGMGYVEFEQAFFPLFPLAMRYFSYGIQQSYLVSGMILVYAMAISMSVLFLRLARLDLIKNRAWWALIGLLSFPTAFFSFALYTEGIFLTCTFASFLCMRKKRFILASIFAGIASATRVVGIFILPALLWEYMSAQKKRTVKVAIQAVLFGVISSAGLWIYMLYLWISTSDPLKFIHSQSAFGAGRSGGEIILLPQVVWRYIKILITVPRANFDWWVSLCEVVLFAIVCILLFCAYKKKVRLSYIIFSVCALMFPTLSGTLSSIPRYAFVCFAVYIAFAKIENVWLRSFILTVSISLQVVLCALFLRGYFIS